MSQLFTIALTIFYVLWLCAVLWFLWSIWRNGARYTQKLEQTQLEAAITSAQAAREAAEAARLLAEKHAAKDTRES